MRLVDLELRGCQGITDRGLGMLREMQLITKVCITDSKTISDVGLQVFRGMPLKDVEFKKFRKITDSGLERAFGKAKLHCLAVKTCRKTTKKRVGRLAGDAFSIWGS